MLSRIRRTGRRILGIVLAVGVMGAMFAIPRSTALPLQMSQSIAAQLPTAPVNAKPTNAVVAPGKVHWHATTEAALVAAKSSKKPVLVFQMMGQLDHQFC